MIGPRSALFAPFSKLGIIIIDEEQDGAYKSDTMPKYHAIDVAIRRTAMSGGKVILGSATPSVVTYDRPAGGFTAFTACLNGRRMDQIWRRLKSLI